MQARANPAGRITAMLGPTNTGKTHFAIERMLAHRTGMIGLPLRLLAREVYDKIVRIKGAADVALITGEERIVPAHPRYFVCTVEAMPAGIPVAFLAIDEIQLAADPERGHIFTDRLLRARGEEETMFLGAATMRNAIARFVPDAHFLSRQRLSDLAYTGPRKLTRLPRRSAVVAFSAEDVYGLAEIVRRQRGGAAVVMGALSPRTRNAQVALYQSGEVDFLIATDAIGMGINMDVDHVAFAAREKFDGLGVRALRPDEMGQIAGRAGRYRNDGTFGVTAECEGLDAEMIERIETHRYDPVRVLQWRNNALDFASVDALIASLEIAPPMRGLVKARMASDHGALRMLSSDEDIRVRAKSRDRLRLLWECCQLPDFRKFSPDEHADLVAQIFRHLSGTDGVLPEDWMARQIARLDITEGEVDMLAARLAQIRTWTYAAHRPDWLADPAHWQEKTREIEDRLSDALHEKLTLRFIDRRTSLLLRHLRDEEYLPLTLDESGAVSLGPEYVGKLDGFRFAPDPRAEGIHGRTLRAVALKGLESEIATRARALEEAGDDALMLSEHGRIWWAGAAVGRLTHGAHPLSPMVELFADDLLKGPQREAVQTRLERFVSAHIRHTLGPLMALRETANARGSEATLPPVARGLAFQLLESLGHLDRIEAILPDDLRGAGKALAPFGVRIGRRSIYLPLLLKPKAMGLALTLWAIHRRMKAPPAAPPPGLTSLVLDENSDREALAAAGYRALGPRAVRLDMIERIEDVLSQALHGNAPAAGGLQRILSLLGASEAETLAIVAALGWQRDESAEPVRWQRIAARKHARGQAKRVHGHDNERKKRGQAGNASPDPDSPFGPLAGLLHAD
jgi:ATP-dependent RNA helicase SUPV3L1/SUV3